jgi:hypothetical protein
VETNEGSLAWPLSSRLLGQRFLLMEVVMSAKLLTYEMIASTIPRIPASEFTVLDFIDAFQLAYPQIWKQIEDRYGTYGEKRQYTSSCYISQKIQRFSWKDQELLEPHTPWTVDKEKDFRFPSDKEKERTGGRIIAVYRKKYVQE